MSVTTRVEERPRDPAAGWSTLVASAGAGLILLFLGLAAIYPERFGLLVLLGGLGLTAVVTGLSSPMVAATYFLLTVFFRLAVPDGLVPVDPFLLAFAGLAAAVGIDRWRHRRPLPSIGLILAAIGLYVAWNIGSMLAPHTYPAIFPETGESLALPRFLLIGAVMPLSCFLFGALAFGGRRSVRWLLLLVLASSAYSALVSVLQFYGPSLVWPRYIADAPGWEGRAVGVFNQPVVNGLVLVLGYVAGLLVASHAGQSRVARIAAGTVAVACCFGVYLTHTRSAWLSFAFVVLLGAVLARGWRTGFVLTAGVTALTVAASWSTFTSDDRDAGGVGSTNEVFDRLNMIATALWAVGEKPLLGWGIGRFPVVNTYFHQQWSPSIPWNRGYGYASHFDVLGVAVELGLVGLALWMLMMGLVAARLISSLQQLPAQEMDGQPFAVFALLALVTLLITGLTVDLRFFDFPNIVVLLLVGAVIGRVDRLRRGDSS
ncbi:O-antigen ligase family protein [Nocardioides aurantiacus]|uniref:O-antigen ligase family protein n=1 Tax=Nocardioides aurantiacus TaxID=86796 RepID=UPI00403FAC13